MGDTKHSIFRAAALRRYAQGKDHVVLPRYVSPRSFLYLWLLLALLMGSEVVIWYLSGIPVGELFSHLFGT
jgi:hypothetical protein